MAGSLGPFFVRSRLVLWNKDRPGVILHVFLDPECCGDRFTHPASLDLSLMLLCLDMWCAEQAFHGFQPLSYTQVLTPSQAFIVTGVFLCLIFLFVFTHLFPWVLYRVDGLEIFLGAHIVDTRVLSSRVCLTPSLCAFLWKKWQGPHCIILQCVSKGWHFIHGYLLHSG